MRPAFPVALPGTLWGVTSYWNPCHYRNKVKNFREFRASNKAQGLKMLCVEVAFGRDAFELSERDADILVRLRSRSVLWQKERLLNLGISRLPEECDKVVWLDADIIFSNKDWVGQTGRLLETYKAVQTYDTIVFLDKGQRPRDVDGENLPWGVAEGSRIHSLAFQAARLGLSALDRKSYLDHGHPGSSWAMRRSVLARCGLYDRYILGGADSFMAEAFYGKGPRYLEKFPYKKISPDQRSWARRIAKEVKGSISYVPGIAFHKWHGKRQDRQYDRRYLILRAARFDARRDIRIGGNGCWEWATRKPEFHRLVENYFFERKEE